MESSDLFKKAPNSEKWSALGGLTGFHLTLARFSEGQMIERWPGGSKVTVREKAIDVVDKGQTGRASSGITKPRCSLHRPSKETDTAMLVIAGALVARTTEGSSAPH